MDRQIGQIGIEDVAGVKSRVSWGAIFGGSVISLAVYLLLTMFFTGVGLSLSNYHIDARAGNVAWMAVAAGVLSLVIAMYCGGCTTAILTAGETRREAMIHGLLTWAVVTAMAMWMVGMGVRGGYNALLGASMAAQTQRADAANWEQSARDAGFTQEQINKFKEGAAPQNLRAEAQNPENQEAARRAATIAAWATLAGTLLSIGAAILGGMSGVGPTFRLVPAVVATEQREVSATVIR